MIDAIVNLLVNLESAKHLRMTSDGFAWKTAKSTPPVTLFEIPPGPMLAMGALRVFNTALAYYVYFRFVHDEGPTFASLNNYIAPVIGVIGGAEALAEPIAPSAWAGSALVLAGVALTGRSLQPVKTPRANGSVARASAS